MKRRGPHFVATVLLLNRLMVVAAVLFTVGWAWGALGVLVDGPKGALDGYVDRYAGLYLLVMAVLSVPWLITYRLLHPEHQEQL